MVAWTEKMDATLKEMRGKSSSVLIGEKLGLNRNAVLGRAFRLKLPRIRQSPEHRKQRNKPPRYFARAKKAKAIPAPPPAPIEPLNIPFMELQPHHCREIVVKGGDGLSLSCGHPVMADSSFCRWHHSINYDPPELRRAPPNRKSGGCRVTARAA